MAVVGIAEELAIGRETRIGENGLREYHRVYKVLTDDPVDDGNIVRDATSLPRMYDQYQSIASTDESALVISVDPRQHDKLSRFWLVHVTWSTEWDRIDNPLNEKPLIRYGTEIVNEVVPGQADSSMSLADGVDEEDLLTSTTPGNAQNLLNWNKGKGIANSAGDPYNPPPERPIARPIVTVTRNEASFSPTYKATYENSVNQDAWNGLTKRQAWLRTIEAEALVWRSTRFDTDDIYYWRVTYVFALKFESWDLQLLDFGPYCLTWSADGISGSETPARTAFLTDTGTPRMGLLDNSDTNKPGRELPANAPPQWRRFLVFRTQSFSGLNINLNLSLEDQKTRKRA